MKVYDVEIAYGKYEDSYQTHKLFSTEEKALAYAYSTIEVYDDGYPICPVAGYISEIEVDSNNVKPLFSFIPNYIIIK